MIVIGDRFADVVITDEDADQIEVVGDLIRHIENVDNERRRPSRRRSSDPQATVAFGSARRGARCAARTLRAGNHPQLVGRPMSSGSGLFHAKTFRA